MKLYFTPCKWLCFAILLLLPNTSASASEKMSATFLYEADNEQQLRDVYLIEASLKAFFKEVTVISIENFDRADIQSDVLVGYSQKIHADIQTLRDRIKHYEGEIIALNQFYQYVPQLAIETLQRDVQVYEIGPFQISELITIPNVLLQGDYEVTAVGKGFDGEVPFIVRRNQHYAFLAHDFYLFEIQVLFAKLLAEEIGGKEGHPAYIVVDDINPITEVAQLQRVTNLLQQYEIPMLLMISPVYIDAKSGRRANLSDANELVALLKQLQNEGAQLIVDLVAKSDATTEQSLIDYEQAVQLFAQQALYPTIFSVQQDAQQIDYEEIANHVSSFIGELPISSATIEQGMTPFYINRSSLLNGQKLYPLTLTGEDYQFQDALIPMSRQIDMLKNVDGAVLSTSYSMYLDVEQLERRIMLLQRVPDMYWHDFHQDSYAVVLEKFEIYRNGSELDVVSYWTWIDEAKWFMKERPLEAVLWFFLLLPLLFVTIFMINLFILRLRYRKNLFEERA